MAFNIEWRVISPCSSSKATKEDFVTLEEEAERATELLAGKVVETVLRLRPEEVVVQFTDGSRLFLDVRDSLLEMSITDGSND